MNVLGERIIIFGDSLVHHGRDEAAEIWDVDQGSDRTTSAPGDLLASLLLEQGAQAVRIDANVGRSAHNFWAGTSRHQFSSAADLIASDQAWGPTKVIVMLGTNDADSGVIDAAAMKQIRDTYAGMGAEVWAVGPPIFASDALNANVEAVYAMMTGVFGKRLIDARPLSSTEERAGDGVHFKPTSAQPFAINLANAIVSTKAPRKPWLGISLGVGIFGLLGFVLWHTYRSGPLAGFDEIDDDDDDDVVGLDVAMGDAKLDRKIARQSLKEERKAIHDYGERLVSVESPALKKTIRHARKEERQHAAAFKRLA
jgi:lysophospholipase L1-like esterase